MMSIKREYEAAPQTNVLTCIVKWAKETPEVMFTYNLICDFVHPNISSSFLVASINYKGLYFEPTKGKRFGDDVFEQNFPIFYQ